MSNFQKRKKLNVFSNLAKKICERRFNIGSDGLLTASLSDETVKMRTFNADGTPDFCINGLHCLAFHLFDQKKIARQQMIEQLGKKVQVYISDDGFISSLISAASFVPNEVPLQAGLPELFMTPVSIFGCEVVISALTTGTSHTVIFEELLPDEERFTEVSQALENHPFFPERTSIIWATAESDYDLTIRIWERGVGETLGCGTGSAAVSVVWSRWKNLKGDFKVSSPGGSTFVQLEHWDQPIWIRTKPQIIFKGFFDVDL